MPFVNTELLNIPFLRDRTSFQGLWTVLLILYLEYFVLLAYVLVQDTQVPLCLKIIFFLIVIFFSIVISYLKINSSGLPKGQATHTTFVMYLCKARN